MNQKSLTQELLQYIAGAFYIRSIADINLDASLIQQEVIDSMGLLEIATFVEQRLGFRVSEQDLNEENFGSVNRIVDFMLSRALVEAL